MRNRPRRSLGHVFGAGSATDIERVHWPSCRLNQTRIEGVSRSIWSPGYRNSPTNTEQTGIAALLSALAASACVASSAYGRPSEITTINRADSPGEASNRRATDTREL